MSDNDKKYGYSFALDAKKYSDKDYTPNYENGDAVEVFGLCYDIHFVFFALDYLVPQIPPNARVYPKPSPTCSVEDFKINYPKISRKLIEGKLDGEVLNIIQHKYLGAIETYFDEIENKADELEHFKNLLYQYVPIEKNEQFTRNEGLNLIVLSKRDNCTFAVRLVEKIRTLLNQLRFKISLSVETHEELQKIKEQKNKRRSVKRNKPRLRLINGYKCKGKRLNSRLKNEGFIYIRTKYQTIDNIFTNDESVIRWIGHKCDLQYFIQQLYVKGIIEKHGRWINAQEIFFDVNDKFTTTLRKNKAKDNPDDETTSIIDSIITDCFTKR